MKHLDDADLMAVMDGEPGPEHLRECARCRARNQALEQALGEFTALHRGSKVPVGIWRTQQRSDLPNASFTSGATRPMTQQQICVALAQDDDRTAPRKITSVELFARVRINHPEPKAFEVEGP